VTNSRGFEGESSQLPPGFTEDHRTKPLDWEVEGSQTVLRPLFHLGEGGWGVRFSPLILKNPFRNNTGNWRALGMVGLKGRFFQPRPQAWGSVGSGFGPEWAVLAEPSLHRGWPIRAAPQACGLGWKKRPFRPRGHHSGGSGGSQNTPKHDVDPGHLPRKRFPTLRCHRFGLGLRPDAQSLTAAGCHQQRSFR
jgi:hypothetical protein